MLKNSLKDWALRKGSRDKEIQHDVGHRKRERETN